MAELPPLHQRIILDASGVPAAVATTTAGLEAIGGAANATTAELGATRGMMASMFKGTALIAGIMLLAHEFKHMKDETMALEVAQSRLNTVLGNAKGVTDEQKKSASETTEAISKLGFAHSDSTDAMATLVTATGSVSQAQKLMGLTADYARNKHMTLADAAMAMGRATQGNLKAFKAYGIALDATLPKNEAIAKAFDQLNAKIGGTAKNSMNTLGVQLTIMREKFQEIANKIGAVVLPILTGLIKGLSFLFTYIEKNRVALGIFGTGLIIIIGYMKIMAFWEAILAAENPMTPIVLGVIALAAAFAWLWNHIKVFRETFAETLATIIQLIGYVVGGFASLARVLSHVPGMGFMKGVADAADNAALSIGKASKAVDDLKNKKITAPKSMGAFDFAKPGTKTGITGNVAGGDATKGGGGGGGTGTIQNITVYASNTNDIARQMAKAQKQGTPIGAK
jgi:hypothetical protein